MGCNSHLLCPALFYEFYSFQQFLDCRISKTSDENAMILSTAQLLVFKQHQPMPEVCSSFHSNLCTFDSNTIFENHRTIKNASNSTPYYLYGTAERLHLCVISIATPPVKITCVSFRHTVELKSMHSKMQDVLESRSADDKYP